MGTKTLLRDELIGEIKAIFLLLIADYRQAKIPSSLGSNFGFQSSDTVTYIKKQLEKNRVEASDQEISDALMYLLMQLLEEDSKKTTG